MPGLTELLKNSSKEYATRYFYGTVKQRMLETLDTPTDERHEKLITLMKEISEIEKKIIQLIDN